MFQRSFSCSTPVVCLLSLLWLESSRADVFQSSIALCLLTTLTCQGWLKEVQCSVKCHRPVSPAVKTLATAAPQWAYIFPPRWSFHCTEPQDATHNHAVPPSPNSTRRVRSCCSLSLITLFVIALFSYSLPQRSRCTCPLSNIWHLDLSLGGCLCNSSSTLLKLVQYSGSEACPGSSEVKLFQALVGFKRSGCHKHFC